MTDKPKSLADCDLREATHYLCAAHDHSPEAFLRAVNDIRRAAVDEALERAAQVADAHERKIAFNPTNYTKDYVYGTCDAANTIASSIRALNDKAPLNP